MPRFRHLFTLVLAVALLVAPAAHSASPNMVVNQLFAGGGNANAPYANDFVELFNRGAAAVDLSNWSIQYASATSTTWQVTSLSGSVRAGGRYLVQLASAGAVGVPLPTPDATGTSNLAVAGGKIAVVRGAAPLSCGAAAGSCSADPLVADLVGYGSATDYEGAGPAPAIGNATAAARAGDGCTDTDVNSSDFSAEAPTPRNSAAAAAPCSGTVPPAAAASANAAVDVDIQPDLPLGLSATAPTGGQIGGQLGGGAIAPIPIAPAPDLLIGTTAAPSAPAGDGWGTNVGFASPLPAVAPGHYTATVTFTVIGR